MQRLELKATHKPVQNYYAALRQFDNLGVTHETAVRSAFQGLLDYCARQYDWTLVPEWEIRRPRQHPLRADCGVSSPTIFSWLTFPLTPPGIALTAARLAEGIPIRC